MAPGGTLAAGGTSTTTWLEVFVSGWPPGGVPITEASLANFPSLTSARVHVYVVDPPEATADWPGPPASVFASQCSSVNSVSTRGTSPVFVTTIWYSTVCPTAPVKGDVVKPALLPAISWSFSIVNSGF